MCPWHLCFGNVEPPSLLQDNYCFVMTFSNSRSVDHQFWFGFVLFISTIWERLWWRLRWIPSVPWPKEWKGEQLGLLMWKNSVRTSPWHMSERSFIEIVFNFFKQSIPEGLPTTYWRTKGVCSKYKHPVFVPELLWVLLANKPSWSVFLSETQLFHG